MWKPCGKTYSSEWNLERHKRESCPGKGFRPKGTPNIDKNANDANTEDTVIIVGSVKFAVSRQALSRSSAYFASLFQLHEPMQGDVHVDVDPNEFQMLLDAHNNPTSITVSNIDAVALLADKLKFTTVYDHCEKYISEKLPQFSVMHAIRLAEQLKLSAIKQRLFDSISIDVFRSLSADQDYRLMGADLKAELLEKWGTFL
ncbi:unnamed protein product, partial [Mesorhabditis belari]|uniref:C2H2-type domain-containing protein n=1 Tax=Mesorhabditis belari TaxID=2138241 RepID=A0AAF3EZU4_9BILA